MRLKMLVGIGLTVYAAFGNVCMVQLASAEGHPPMSHNEHAAMTTTAEGCDTCAAAGEADPEPGRNVPCAGGHCLSTIAESAPAAGTASFGVAAIAFPIPIAPLPLSRYIWDIQPTSTAPPWTSFTHTTVLRC